MSSAQCITYSIREPRWCVNFNEYHVTVSDGIITEVCSARLLKQSLEEVCPTAYDAIQRLDRLIQNPKVTTTAPNTDILSAVKNFTLHAAASSATSPKQQEPIWDESIRPQFQLPKSPKGRSEDLRLLPNIMNAIAQRVFNDGQKTEDELWEEAAKNVAQFTMPFFPSPYRYAAQSSINSTLKKVFEDRSPSLGEHLRKASEFVEIFKSRVQKYTQQPVSIDLLDRISANEFKCFQGSCYTNARPYLLTIGKEEKMLAFCPQASYPIMVMDRNCLSHSDSLPC